jgi:hypothetical protein
MATIFNQTDTCRVYVRGHRGDSRYFISRMINGILQRCSVPEAVADSLKCASDDVLDTTIGKYLDAAQKEVAADYYEIKTGEVTL